MGQLASDFIFEILSHTSLETLEQCKAVSRSWKQIIYEPTFLPLHCQRTNSIFGYFFQYVKYHKYLSALASSAPAAIAAAIKATWPSDDMKILASCDQGLLCCERQIGCYNKRYYACKPATTQWQALPNPKLRYETAAVAIVVVQSHPLRYVIVRLSKICSPRSRTSQYNCEIFDSKIWGWEEIGFAGPDGEIINPRHPAVTVGGRYVHWLTCGDNVVALDVEERRFRWFPLPEAVKRKPAYTWKQLMEYEGGLGLTCLAEEGERSEMEVWTAEGRKAVVDMRVVGESLWHPHPVEFCNSGVVFMTTADGPVFYNIRNRSFSKVEVPYHVRHPHQIFRFRSDFQMVHLKPGPSQSQSVFN